MNIFRKSYKAQFEELFKKNYQRLFYCALDIVNDEAAARDIVSDVFTDLWEKFRNLHRENFDGFLYTTVRNRSIDYLRHVSVAREYEKLFLQEECEWEETEEDQEENIQRIYDIMDQFTPRTRTIFEECYFNGKKYQEVAEEMGISTAAVHKHIVKAFATFRREFSEKKSNR